MTVSFTEGDGGWTYVWDHRRKPHLHPVVTPSGLVLTQVEPPDHPWQRGLWFVVKFVDGDNFWEEGHPDGWGVQRHPDSPLVTAHSVEGDLVWIRPDRSTVAIREHRRLRHVPLGPDAYAIDWDVTLVSPAPAVLDRSPYMGIWGGYSGLALRGRADWHDTRLLLDDGSVHERVAPQPSRWCDISGWVDADAGGVSEPRAAGICILDHPSNPSHPVPFYATTRAGLGYTDGGEWSNTVYPSFLWHAPLHLEPDTPLPFHYRVIVHDDLWTHDQTSAAWHAYTTDPLP